MNKLNYQGLVFETSCKYFYIHTGDNFALRENKKSSVYEIIYPEGSTADEVSRILGVSREGENQKINEMSRPEKFNEISNGLKYTVTYASISAFKKSEEIKEEWNNYSKKYNKYA